MSIVPERRHEAGSVCVLPGPSTSADTAKKEDGKAKEAEEDVVLPRLSEQLMLDELWEVLGSCLMELSKTPDHHAVLVLQPAVEAFFLVHAGWLARTL